MSKIYFEGTTLNELTNLLLSEFDEKLKILEKKINPQTNLLSRKETANKLDVDVSTLFNWSKRGILKAHSLGGRVYYKLEDIEKALIELEKPL